MTDAARNTSSPFDAAGVAQTIATWRRPLLISHERPDGDALGSLIALREMLVARGANPLATVYESVPKRYGFLASIDKLHIWSGMQDADANACDGVVVVDTAAWGQLTAITPWLRQADKPIVVIDHHQTRDADLGIQHLIDPTAAAAALLVYRLGRAAGWTISLPAATAIFVGIATDTGWFRYSNTTPECMRVAADLMECGVDVDALHKAIYLNDPVSGLRGRSAALSGLQLFSNDRVAIVSVTRATLESAGATPADLEDLVNVPLAAASVEVSVALVAWDPGTIKTSFRSKGAVDVAKLAAKFGGGGHSRAAGARISGSLDEVRVRLLEAIQAAFG